MSSIQRAARSRNISCPIAARDPHTLLFDNDGVLWFTVQNANMLGRLDPKSGAIKLVTMATPSARPYGMALSADGRSVFFDLFGSNKIARVDRASMAITEYPLPDGSSRPRRIAVSGDGFVWYSDYARGRLGRLDPQTGKVTEYPSPGGPQSQPYAIAALNGAVWYVETGVQPNVLVRFDPATEKFQTWTIPSGGGVVRNMMPTPRRQFGVGLQRRQRRRACRDQEAGRDDKRLSFRRSSVRERRASQARALVVVDFAIGEMLGARLCARHFQTHMSARRPAVHHGVGHVGMKLQREASPIPESLHLEHVAFGQKLGAARQPEAFAVPLIDLLRPVADQREPRRRRPDRIIADLGLSLRVGKHPAPSARANICAPRQMPRNGLSSFSGTVVQSISR